MFDVPNIGDTHFQIGSMNSEQKACFDRTNELKYIHLH